jgi:hypothetical protein
VTKRFGGRRPGGTDETYSFWTVKTSHWQKGRRRASRHQPLMYPRKGGIHCSYPKVDAKPVMGEVCYEVLRWEVANTPESYSGQMNNVTFVVSDNEPSVNRCNIFYVQQVLLNLRNTWRNGESVL